MLLFYVRLTSHAPPRPWHSFKAFERNGFLARLAEPVRAVINCGKCGSNALNKTILNVKLMKPAVLAHPCVEFMLPVKAFDTLHVIAGGETTRLQEARGLRTPVRETCAANGMKTPATSAEYRGIACRRAIFVPTTPRLLIAFQHHESAGIADIGQVPG